MFKFQEVFTAACVAGAFWGSTLFGAEIWREAETADTHNWTHTCPNNFQNGVIF